MNPEEQIEEIFSPGGTLSEAIEGYEHRPQQTQMALEVYRALQSGDRLIVEAPTGTGKTLAYLVAAALSRQRVAVSTGTKNLQEQLFFKDIPFLREKIFPTLKAALLKGRSNFVCHTRLLRYIRQPRFQGMGGTTSVEDILTWYQWTRDKGQGDRAELENLPDDDPLWPEICSTTETCAGKKCPDRDACFVMRMRARAADADLMVVNHHLLTSDLAVKESGFGEVIPRYEALIVDEAHGLEDAATSHFGFHVSHFRIARLVRDTGVELNEAGISEGKHHDTLRALDETSRRFFKTFQEMVPPRTRVSSLNPELRESGRMVCQNLESLAVMLANLAQESEEFEPLARRGASIREELETILSEEPSGEYACWSEDRQGILMLHASPVDVGELMKSRLYERVRSVVFTSATLSSGGSFDYFKSRLGLDSQPEPAEILLDTPFDYDDQTILYVPKSLPEPNAPGFVDAVSPILKDVLERTHGRAFVLFTSHRNMQQVHRRLVGHVPFPLLIQGSRPKTRLLEEFKTKPGSVLFATSSFWEGVDVQGEALSCVVVDRLPFAPPDDPIISARIERIRLVGGDPFASFQVPMAVIALKQGLGRLVRNRSDVGVFCILDIRILTKPYGRVFLKSLHTGPLHRNPHQIDGFFARHEP